MTQYMRNMYLVKSEPNLMQLCIQILAQHCKTLNQNSSCNAQSHDKKPPLAHARVLWISETPPEFDVMMVYLVSNLLTLNMLLTFSPNIIDKS